MEKLIRIIYLFVYCSPAARWGFLDSIRAGRELQSSRWGTAGPQWQAPIARWNVGIVWRCNIRCIQYCIYIYKYLERERDVLNCTHLDLSTYVENIHTNADIYICMWIKQNVKHRQNARWHVRIHLPERIQEYMSDKVPDTMSEFVPDRMSVGGSLEESIF